MRTKKATKKMPTKTAKKSKSPPRRPSKAERDRKDSELEGEEESERGNAPPEE